MKYAKYPKKSTIMRNLFHPIAMEWVKKFYNQGLLGKVMLVGFQKLKMLTMEVELHEKKGEYKPPYPRKMANALATLALHQFAQLDKFNTHRRMCANQYYKKLKRKFGLKAINPSSYPGAIFLRYPLLFKEPKAAKKLFKKAKKEGIILGDWYSSAIAPPKCTMEKTHYDATFCPTTEDVCGRVLNLPTYHSLTDKDIETILKLF